MPVLDLNLNAMQIQVDELSYTNPGPGKKRKREAIQWDEISSSVRGNPLCHRLWSTGCGAPNQSVRLRWGRQLLVSVNGGVAKFSLLIALRNIAKPGPAIPGRVGLSPEVQTTFQQQLLVQRPACFKKVG